MGRTTLAAHDDYLITLHHAEKPEVGPLVITFGGQPSKRTPEGFGTGFCLANDWDTIYVAQRAGTQYQGLDASTFRDAVAPVADGRDTVCYGSSLGGYAALFWRGYRCADRGCCAHAACLAAVGPQG